VGRVFISYRRADAEADAGRLYADLAYEFGADRLFKDVDNVPLGADIREHIEAAIADSSVVVVVVGPSWEPRRLHDELDWVRIEIEVALATGVLVVPIRVRRAELPKVAEVPASISRFCGLNAAELEHPSWKRDLRPVVEVIRGALGMKNAAAVEGQGPPQFAPAATGLNRGSVRANLLRYDDRRLETFGPVPIGGLKSEVNRIFDALSDSRRVLISRSGVIVAAIDPVVAVDDEVLASYDAQRAQRGVLVDLSAGAIARGSASSWLADVELGEQVYVTKSARVYGVLRAARGTDIDNA